MAWATLDQFKKNQSNLEGDGTAEGNAIITLSLNMTGSRITSCLYNGGYPVATLEAAVAAGASYDLLVLLNIRMAALDLMSGGGSSSYSGASQEPYDRWYDWIEATLEKLCRGMLALEDSTGSYDTTEPPMYSTDPIITDSREPSVDLVDPLYYPETDPLNSDLDGLGD